MCKAGFERDAAAASAASAAARLGHALVDEGYPVTPAHLAIATPTVYITCLREPVSRALSSYFFEGRMPIGGMETFRNKQTGKDEKRRATPKTLAEHIAFVQSGKEVRRRIATRRCWLEVQNYYVQIFAGQNTGGPVGAEHVSRARQTLNSFDVVLILEWMGDAEHRAPSSARRAACSTNLRSNAHTANAAARCALSKTRCEPAPRARAAPRGRARRRAPAARLNADDTRFYSMRSLAFRMGRGRGGEAAPPAAAARRPPPPQGRRRARRAVRAVRARQRDRADAARGESRAELPRIQHQPHAGKRLPSLDGSSLDADAREREQAVRRDDRRRQARRRRGRFGPAAPATSRRAAVPLAARPRAARAQGDLRMQAA